MYDRPETREANDRLWRRLRRSIDCSFSDLDEELPSTLDRSTDVWSQWQSPDLILSQTCSLPYRSRLHDKVMLLGAPIHDLECPPGHYFSVIVTRRSDPRRDLSDFRGSTLAINDRVTAIKSRSAPCGRRRCRFPVCPNPRNRESSDLKQGGCRWCRRYRRD